MTGKYSDPIAEAAEAILNDGFADDQCGTVEYGGEHYALVTLTADALAHTEAWFTPGSRIIIRTDSQGFVDTFYGPAHPAGDPAAYAALQRAWAEIVAEAGGDGALTNDECEAIGADGRDGRGEITENNLTPAERVMLDAYRATGGAA